MYLAIDADYLVYSCGFASDGDPVEYALHTVKKKLNSYISDVSRMFGEPVFEVFISPKTNFRNDITDTYKAQRVDSPKPVHYEAIREYLLDTWNAKMVEGLEADDLVAIRHMKRWIEDPQSSVIAACDKDLWTVPGWHYNTYAGTSTIPGKFTFEYIDMFTADYNLYTQMLTGDKVDNIMGVPGIGPKKAEKLLESATTVEELSQIVKDTYKLNFDKDWEDMYNLNYRLLYILRSEDDIRGG